MALLAPNVSCAPVIMESRRCPLCATSRRTCLTTYFGTGPQQRLGGVVRSCPCRKRRTSYVLRRDSHGRRIDMPSDAGQFVPEQKGKGSIIPEHDDFRTQ